MTIYSYRRVRGCFGGLESFECASGGLFFVTLAVSGAAFVILPRVSVRCEALVAITAWRFFLLSVLCELGAPLAEVDRLFLSVTEPYCWSSAPLPDVVSFSMKEKSPFASHSLSILWRKPSIKRSGRRRNVSLWDIMMGLIGRRAFIIPIKENAEKHTNKQVTDPSHGSEDEGRALTSRHASGWAQHFRVG